MRRTGTLGNWVLGLTAAGGLVAIILARVAAMDSRQSALPDLDPKPRPVATTFHDCPADGDGGDHVLNYLKNRTDEATWIGADLNAIRGLSRPGGIDRVPRSSWGQSQGRAVRRAEGLPLSVEGYLVAVREEGSESTNCHESTPESRDWHLWLATLPGASRADAVVVEVTPRVRALHAGWDIRDLEEAARNGDRVRISGWLLLDQEHPEQLGKSRATLWEIHPIMRVQFWQGDRWADW